MRKDLALIKLFTSFILVLNDAPMDDIEEGEAYKALLAIGYFSQPSTSSGLMLFYDFQ